MNVFGEAARIAADCTYPNSLPSFIEIMRSIQHHCLRPSLSISHQYNARDLLILAALYRATYLDAPTP